MAAQKKKKIINLLPREEFESSTMGRVLKWITSSFRIIVVLSELIVMIGFLSRFWLDARITDLNEQIEVNQLIIRSFESFENDFRATQRRLSIFTALTPQERLSLPIVTEVSSFMPSDVRLSSVSLIEDDLSVKATSFSEQSVAQFIANLENAQRYQDIALVQIQSEEEAASIGFTIKATLARGG